MEREQLATASNAVRAGQLAGVVALAHVADVARSIEFYEKLGFRVANTVKDGERLQWASLELNGAAQLMLARSGRPMNPGAQDVLFYLYASNIAEYRKGLEAQGIAVGELQYPFYSPRGEFRVTDPDGYDLFIAHAD